MKILICDDHKIVRDGLKKILSQLEGKIQIEEAGKGIEAIHLLKSGDFDVVLLDLSLPDMSGLEVLQWVKEKRLSTNVLVLSMYPHEQYAIRALNLGASGYLTKDTASEELLHAVKKVSSGKKYISLALAESLASRLSNDFTKKQHEILSNREFDIMIRLAGGKSLQKIGDELFISNKTVSTYRSRIMEKMNMTKNTDLARYCIENQLI